MGRPYGQLTANAQAFREITAHAKEDELGCEGRAIGLRWVEIGIVRAYIQRPVAHSYTHARVHIHCFRIAVVEQAANPKVEARQANVEVFFRLSIA